MATLLKIGTKTINMDQVFEIDDYGDRLRLYYLAASSDTNGVQQPAYAELNGAEAEALRRWIAQNATDLGATPE
jgi:pyruvate carboxylase